MEKFCYNRMMFDNLLFLHILIAVVMAGTAVRSIVDIVRGRLERLPRNAKALSVLMLLQAASGSLLGLLSPEFSVIHFCVNVGLYIAGFLLVEFAIFIALKKNPLLIFPHLFARVSVGASLTAFFLVIVVRTSLF